MIGVASLIFVGVLLLAFAVRAQSKRLDAKRREKEVRDATEDLPMIPNYNKPEEEPT